MERNEISRHEIAVFSILHRQPDAWFTSAQLAEKAGVAPRTARAHALKLVKANLVDQAEVFPAHRYRFAETASKRNRGYYERLTRAAEVFSIPLTKTGGTT